MSAKVLNLPKKQLGEDVFVLRMRAAGEWSELSDERLRTLYRGLICELTKAGLLPERTLQ
jgi:hypothetical protein